MNVTACKRDCNNNNNFMDVLIVNSFILNFCVAKINFNSHQISKHMRDYYRVKMIETSKGYFHGQILLL